ncbi:MAG: ABC transporter permease [Lacunisphaera sp.]
MTDEQVAALRKMPQVELAQPLLFGLVSSGDRPIITCFGLEGDNTRLTKARWIEGTVAEFGRVKDGIWLGSRAAEFLKAKKGETVEIGNGEFVVAGVFATENGFEDGGVFLPLKTAQEFSRARASHRSWPSSCATSRRARPSRRPWRRRIRS